MFQTDTCPKNPRKMFGFINIEGPHKLDTIKVKPWGGEDWHMWEATATCSHCGSKFHTIGLTDVELVRAGIHPNLV